ncbi:MAG: TlpA family protein disulfide reductase [Sciscionella sp.]
MPRPHRNASGRLRRPRVWLLLVALAVVLSGCSTGKDAVVQGSEFTFVAPGGKREIHYPVAERKPLPPLSGQSLTNAGKTISLSDFAGKVVVLNIWGSWCPPCRAEAPELQKLSEQEKGSGVQVLGIDVRDPDRSAPRDFVRDRNITYPSIYDASGRTLLALNGYPRNVVPSTIVLDRRHRVAAVFLKPLLADDLRPTLRQLSAAS